VALDPFGRPKGGMWPGLFFAGQLTGVEGYVESIMSGLLAGWNAVRVLEGEEPELPPRESMIGGLYAYLREADPERFQPMNANFGLLPPADPRARGKRERRAALSARALAAIEAWAEAREPTGTRIGAR
jgi:methylenetetrahydrofolate--tRNA-(uracil-5-)-methyltransferase